MQAEIKNLALHEPYDILTDCVRAKKIKNTHKEVNIYMVPSTMLPRFDPWVGKIPWRRKWLPTPVFLPEEFHGQWSLVATAHRVTQS